MKDTMMQITHRTGIYRMSVPHHKIEEMRELLLLCLKGEQAAFTSKDDNGKETVYPAELLRNSVITFEIDNGITSGSGISSEWNE